MPADWLSPAGAGSASLSTSHSEGFGTVHLASELIATAKGLR
ncbi:hypothetical protein [Streptomyces sp. NPDC005407]